MLDLIMVLPVSIFKVILKIIDNVIAYLLRWDQKLLLDKKKSNNLYLPQEVSVFAASLSLRESKRTSMVYGAIQSLTEYINKLQIYYMKISQVRILVMFELAESALAMLYLPQTGFWAAPLSCNVAMLKNQPHILAACGDGLLPWQQGKDAPGIKKKVPLIQMLLKWTKKIKSSYPQ